MNKKMLIFEYDNKKFLGILEYKEGKLIDLAGDVIYKFELLSPFDYQIEYFKDKPKSNMGRMGFSLKDITLCKIVDEVIDKVIHYYINKEQIDYFKRLETYVKAVDSRLESIINHLIQKNQELEGQISNLRQQFENEELSQREYQFKRKEIQTKIDENNHLIQELKQELLKSPYFEFEDGELKKECLIPYDKSKAIIKEIRDFKFKKLSQEELKDKIKSIESVEIPEFELYEEDFKYFLKEKVYFFETRDIDNLPLTGEESGVLIFVRIGTRDYYARDMEDIMYIVQHKVKPDCNVQIGWGIDRSIQIEWPKDETIYSKIKIELYVSY